MSQQGLDLHRSVQFMRRYKIVLAAAFAVGLIGGAAYATLNPPMRTSKALVVLPSVSGPSMATQVVVAGSDPVLSNALQSIGSGVTLQTLHNDVTVSSLTSNVIQVSATSKSGSRAEAMADAVANSYLTYVSAATSPVGHVRAKLLQGATSATGPTVVKQTTMYGLIGALGGLALGWIVALVLGKGDRRLRARDEIANSIGVPVLLSIPVEHPSDAPGWTKLMEGYEPGVVHAWRLRMALQHFGEAASRNGGVATVGILSLATDPRALAIGPHIAAYAASQGIPTALVVGPQQDSKVTAALRTACAAPLSGTTERAKFLRAIASEDGKVGPRMGASLVVAVTVVDARSPHAPEMMPTATTLLAVTSGATTAEQLARVATVAARDGREITGFLVADPDPTDATTGRIPRLGAPARGMTPTRVNGIPTESRR